MQRVFSDSGLAPVRTWDRGVEHLVMRLDVSDDLVDRIAESRTRLRGAIGRASDAARRRSP